EKTYAAIAAAEAGRAVAMAAGAEATGPSSQPQMIENVVTPGTAEQSGAAVSIPETNEEAAYAAAASASGITPLAVSDTRVDSNAESAAIASIVDSVLAELKPKLVKEIAKKMSRDRKK